MPTSRPKLKVIVTRRLPEPVETRMSELFDVELNTTDTPLTIEQLGDAAARCDVLVPTITDRIDGRTLARAGDRMRLIAQFGVGVNNIDVQACISRGITVTNTPGVLTEDTADMTMGLILSVPRRIVDGVAAMQSGQFTGWSPTWMLGRRIYGKRLGIIGMGRIGTAVARRARAFGLQIHYHNRKPVRPQVQEELEDVRWRQRITKQVNIGEAIEDLMSMQPNIDFGDLHVECRNLMHDCRVCNGTS